MPFRFSKIRPFDDACLIEPVLLKDDRGWFTETFKQSEFRENGILLPFVQDNHTYSKKKGTLRGLHYQAPPHEQGKLVRCTRGAAYDVMVDLRATSKSFGKWAALELSAENQKCVWVPPRFAHGLATLVDETEIQYKVTAEYNASHERAVRWDDPDLGISWPSIIKTVSAKDRNAPLLKDTELVRGRHE